MINIQVEGLDNLLNNFREHTNLVNSELRKAESDSLTLLRNEARRLAPGYKLANSIQKQTGTDGLMGQVFSAAKTAYSIEKGRPNSEDGTNLWPSIEKIQGWMRRKGIAIGASVSVKSHRPRKFRAGSNEEQQLRADAVQIIKQMKATGSTRPQPFITPAAPNMTGQIDNRFAMAVINVVRILTK